MYSNSALRETTRNTARFFPEWEEEGCLECTEIFYIDVFRWRIVVGRSVSRKFFVSIANKYQRKRTIENATTRKCPVDQLLDYSK